MVKRGQLCIIKPTLALTQRELRTFVQKLTRAMAKLTKIPKRFRKTVITKITSQAKDKCKIVNLWKREKKGPQTNIMDITNKLKNMSYNKH